MSGHGYALEQALAAWQATRDALLRDDPALENDEAALVDLLGAEEGAIEDILARILRAAVHATSMANAASERVEALQAREQRYAHRAETLRRTAFAVMDSIGLKKFEREDFTASVVSGRAAVRITDIDSVPDIYVTTTVSKAPDKRTLLALMKTGTQIPGAELSNTSPSLQLRTR